VTFRRILQNGTLGRLNRFPYTWEFYNDLCAYWKKKEPLAAAVQQDSLNESAAGFEGEDGNENEDNPGQNYKDGDVEEGKGTRKDSLPWTRVRRVWSTRSL